MFFIDSVRDTKELATRMYYNAIEYSRPDDGIYSIKGFLDLDRKICKYVNCRNTYADIANKMALLEFEYVPYYAEADRNAEVLKQRGNELKEFVWEIGKGEPK